MEQAGTRVMDRVSWQVAGTFKLKPYIWSHAYLFVCVCCMQAYAL